MVGVIVEFPKKTITIDDVHISLLYKGHLQTQMIRGLWLTHGFRLSIYFQKFHAIAWLSILVN